MTCALIEVLQLLLCC